MCRISVSLLTWSLLRSVTNRVPPEKRDLRLPIVSRLFSNHPPFFPIAFGYRCGIPVIDPRRYMLVLEESTLGLGGQFQVILVWNGMESLDCLRSRVTDYADRRIALGLDLAILLQRNPVLIRIFIYSL
jgi:hypothetical protein